MQFGSFVPRRNATPRPTDQDATEINPEWSSTLHRHLQAQTPPKPNVVPPVGPTQLGHTVPLDGIRQPPPPPPFNDETSVFTRINRPQQLTDPTDIGAQIYQTQTSEPYFHQRVLEYYGNPQIKNIVTVAGYQVHNVTRDGVWITENGPQTARTFIPWHRVHKLQLSPGDPLYHNHNRNN